MTKVLARFGVRWLLLGCLLAANVSLKAQDTLGGPPARTGASAPQADCPQTAADLYTRLRTVGLDERRVYRVREASIDRPNLHFDFDDGTLAFTKDICGRITGAYFEGAAEVRLRPPNKVERESLALFTGMALLEEQFNAAYLRFNDDTAITLMPFLSPAEDGAEFVKRSETMIEELAQRDAMRLLVDFSHFLPIPGGKESGFANSRGWNSQQFPRSLHAHVLGTKLGEFEVFWDGATAEPVWVGQPRLKDNVLFFDVWTSFVPAAPDLASRPSTRKADETRTAPAPAVDDVSITKFQIQASVQPPTRLQVSTTIDLTIRKGGERTLIFELSRYLKVDRVEEEGRRLEFIQNQALEGTQLRRRGNDMVAVVFPAPLGAGQQLKLHFAYAGEVLSEAGSGLLYVGERGTWYPNFGLSPAQFDLEFRYPANWTLVATGKQVQASGQDTDLATTGDAEEREGKAELVSHWISERPIPVAGFNLGRYVSAETKSGSVVIQAYGTKGVERSFPKAPTEIIETPNFPGLPSRRIPPNPIIVTPESPSPARNVEAVAERAAKAMASFSSWFGPYPYSSLAFTQMPGDLSQGWPGLVFLSSFAFLNPQEQEALRIDAVNRILDSQVLVHEMAHQWWGDLLLWKSYRDQWIMEGLANYSALLVLEQKSPAQFRQVLERYRTDLLSKNKDGENLRDAGPVTLGQRLISSHFPGGYEAISYERGTWLFHMLRSMLRDSETTAHSRKAPPDREEPFFQVLRKVRERYAGKRISTADLIHVFEEELPRPLWYEDRHSLDWFLDGWINGTAIPVLETRDVRFTRKERGAIVSGMIVQKDAPEDLVTAVPVYAGTVGNSLVFLGEVLADGRETSFRLSAPRDARRIVLDPERTVLTTLK